MTWRWAFFLFTVMRLWMLQKAGKLLTSRGALVLYGLHVSLAVFRTRSPLLQHPVIKDASQEKVRRVTKTNTFFCFFTLSSSLRRDLYIPSISTPLHVPDAVTRILYYACVCMYMYRCVCVCIYIYIHTVHFHTIPRTRRRDANFILCVCVYVYV